MSERKAGDVIRFACGTTWRISQSAADHLNAMKARENLRNFIRRRFRP